MGRKRKKTFAVTHPYPSHTAVHVDACDTSARSHHGEKTHRLGCSLVKGAHAVNAYPHTNQVEAGLGEIGCCCGGCDVKNLRGKPRCAGLIHRDEETLERFFIVLGGGVRKVRPDPSHSHVPSLFHFPCGFAEGDPVTLESAVAVQSRVDFEVHRDRASAGFSLELVELPLRRNSQVKRG
jgi:hypothetical protein